MAQFAQQVQAAAVGQADVEHQQVKGLQLQLAPRVLQQQAVQHLQALALQAVGHGAGDGGVVFQQKQAVCHVSDPLGERGTRAA